MLKRERAKKAILHQQTDIVPHNIELTQEEMHKVTEYLGIEKSKFSKWAGNHFDKVGYDTGGECIRPGYYRDEFGVVWNRSGIDKDIGLIDEVILKEPHIGDYSFPQADLTQIRYNTAQFIKKETDTFKLGKLGFALFERAWSLRGMENLLMDFILEPKFVEELFEKILDYNLSIINTALEFDLDGFYIGDDYGQQQGLIMGPDVWRKFIKPSLKKMFDKIKGAGKVVVLHSCGDIAEIFPDMIEIGLDVYQTFQPEIYDIKNVKTQFGNDLTFWGGISTQRLLPYATPEEIRIKVREIREIMSKNGGYIVAPTHQVPADVPAENIVALVETMKDGEY